MRLIKFIILFFILFGCSQKEVSIDTSFNLPKEKRHITQETLQFDLTVGYDKNVNVYRVRKNLMLVLKGLEEEINVKFNILDEKHVIISTKETNEMFAHCALQLNPSKRESDKHLHLCFIDSEVKIFSDDFIAIGGYMSILGAALIGDYKDDFQNMNTIKHEIGHFLGAGHTRYGIMQPGLSEYQYFKVFKFSLESIQEIREKQK